MKRPFRSFHALLGTTVLLVAALIVGCQEVPVAPDTGDAVVLGKKGGGGEKPPATINFPSLLTGSTTVPNAITSPGVQTNVHVFKDNATTLTLQGTEGLNSVLTSHDFNSTKAAAEVALQPGDPSSPPVFDENVCRLWVPKKAEKKIERRHVEAAIAFFVDSERPRSLWLELDKQAISNGEASDGNTLIRVASENPGLRSGTDILASDVFPEAGAPKVTVLNEDPISGTTYRFHAGTGVAKIIASPGDIANFAVHCRLQDTVDFVVDLTP